MASREKRIKDKKTMLVCKSMITISMIVSLISPSISAFTIHNLKSPLKTPNYASHKYNHALAAASVGMETSSNLPPGLLKQTTKPGKGPPIRVGDVATIRYTCEVIDENSERVALPFAKSPAQKFVVGDGLMIDGWDLALQSMQGGERSVVRITDPILGYGAAGVPPFVPENAIVEMDLEILEVEAGVDLGTIASADPLKPRTPASIAAAYNTRRENAAAEEANQAEGIEGLIAKFKTFYFFGFFEGETGQQAPWYLRPSITFPLAFAVVGAAFWVTISQGGISERGAQVTDELDEFIVSMNNGDVLGGGLVGQALIMAFLANMGMSM